jgi:hypothetical protein
LTGDRVATIVRHDASQQSIEIVLGSPTRRIDSSGVGDSCHLITSQDGWETRSERNDIARSFAPRTEPPDIMTGSVYFVVLLGSVGKILVLFSRGSLAVRVSLFAHGDVVLAKSQDTLRCSLDVRP